MKTRKTIGLYKKMRQILTLVAVFVMVLLTVSCSMLSHKYRYYSDKENYITQTGTVTYFAYNEDNTALFIDISGMTQNGSDLGFKIVGKSLETVKANSIDKKLKTGEQMTLIFAPAYFGDGYIIPITALSIDGESLLDFEDGYRNLLDWFKE